MFMETLTIRDRSTQVNITSYGQNAESVCLQQVISVLVTVPL